MPAVCVFTADVSYADYACFRMLHLPVCNCVCYKIRLVILLCSCKNIKRGSNNYNIYGIPSLFDLVTVLAPGDGQPGLRWQLVIRSL